MQRNTLVSPETLRECIAATRTHGTAIAVAAYRLRNGGHLHDSDANWLDDVAEGLAITATKLEAELVAATGICKS